MANNFTALGDVPLFPFEPTWSEMPRISPVILRRIVSHRGTVQQVESTQGDVPVKLTFGYSLLTSADIMAMTSFFLDRKGRLGRFWIRHPLEAFSLAAPASINQNLLVCQDNLAARQFQGYERIWMEMADGDLLIRQVTEASADPETGLVTLTLDTNLDRVVNADTLFRIGRMYLVRFDQDDLKFLFATPETAGDITLTFYELVKEYSDL
jgi:hypothetical protein